MAIDFHQMEPPYLHIGLAHDEKRFGQYAYWVNFEERSFAVRVLRGKKMRTRECCFNEISAAFQFPYYFGENWDALDECLADLDWLPAEGYVVLVANTIDVLSQEQDEELKILLQILSSIGVEWTKVQPPKPFHVVLQCSTGELDRVQQRCHSAGVETDVYTL